MDLVHPGLLLGLPGISWAVLHWCANAVTLAKGISVMMILSIPVLLWP